MHCDYHLVPIHQRQVVLNPISVLFLGGRFLGRNGQNAEPFSTVILSLSNFWVEQVLARIEAGAGRDPSELSELRDRCLELFRVTSRGGVPEVWLLGRRLLGPEPST